MDDNTFAIALMIMTTAFAAIMAAMLGSFVAERARHKRVMAALHEFDHVVRQFEALNEQAGVMLQRALDRDAMTMAEYCAKYGLDYDQMRREAEEYVDARLAEIKADVRRKYRANA